MVRMVANRCARHCVVGVVVYVGLAPTPHLGVKPGLWYTPGAKALQREEGIAICMFSKADAEWGKGLAKVLQQTEDLFTSMIHPAESQLTPIID